MMASVSVEDVQENNQEGEDGGVLGTVAEIIRNRAVHFVVHVHSVPRTQGCETFCQSCVDC